MSFGRGEKHVSTDILIIGGGMAGCFAAIKAKEYVGNVTLVDKGVVGRSGATHFAEGDFTFFNPDVHHDMDAWIDQMSRAGEYLSNREWCRILLEDSYDRYNDLISWGVEIYKPDGKIHVHQAGVHEHHCMMNREYAPVLRQKALDIGVQIIDRIVFSELLKQDGKVVGGIGFHTTSGDLYVFKSNAIVMAAGGSSQKAEAWPIHYWTSDGHAMGYRTGAVIAGKEFIGMPTRCIRSEYNASKGSEIFPVPPDTEDGDIDILTRFPSFRAGLMGPLAWPTLNSEGGQVIFSAWEAHCGRAPLYIDYRNLPPERIEKDKHYFARVGTAEVEKIGLNISEKETLEYSAGMETKMNIIAGSGIWPFDIYCASNIPGLYSAGNNCATMVSGAAYAGMGIGLCHAAVTGARAGVGAAKYAMKTENVMIDEEKLKKVKKIVCSPMERKGGFSPRWLAQVLQGFTVPYFIFNVKHEKRLQAALTFIEFMNQHLVPKIRAKDPHEWRLAQETKNMVLNAEMSIRASLFRTESRGAHFREDFPRRDDSEWLAWVKLCNKNGEMQLSKEPVPKDSWPDLSLPYEERYPTILPMEDTALS